MILGGIVLLPAGDSLGAGAGAGPRFDREPVSIGGGQAMAVDAQARAQAEGTVVRLRSGSFRPVGGVEANLGRLRAEAAGLGELRVMLVLEHPLSTEALAPLRRAGVRIGASLGGECRLGKLGAEVDAALLRAAGVRWVGGFYPEDKTPSRVLEEGFGAWCVEPDGRVRLVIRYFPETPAESLRRELEGLGAEVLWVRPELEGAGIVVSPGRLEDLLGLGTVRWVEEAPPPPVTFNDGARAAVQADWLQQAPYGLSGQGVVLGICDSGTVSAGHEDFQGRLLLLETGAARDHSTHVAGTMAGSGAASGTHGGSAGQWRGVAPGARIASFTFGEPVPKHEMLVQVGGVLSQNSWGLRVEPLYGSCGLAGAYSSMAVDFDRVVTGIYGEPLNVVFAAGNLRDLLQTNGCEVGPYGTVGPPATAKNAMAVGAVDTVTREMATFSSWGPTLDGRLKPDVVAPGAQATADLGVTSTVTNGGYAALRGTSMAAPVVSGGVGLLVEDYRRLNNGENPLPSTVRALLVHTAEDLDDATPHYNPGPDYASGYGLVQLQSAVDQLRAGAFVMGEVAPLEVRRYEVVVPEGLPDVKFTLAWDDPAGLENAAVALVNDLDLVVQDPEGTRHYPWTLDPEEPSADAVRTRGDHLNVLEQVEVRDAPVAGTWVVEVVGTTVVEGDAQIFSLVMSPGPDERAPVLKLDHAEAMEDPGEGSNHNGFLDPGEEVLLRTVLVNPYVPTATNVSAVLESASDHVQVLTGSADYPSLPPGAAVTNLSGFRLRLSRDAPCGMPLALVQVTDADGYRFTNHLELIPGEYVITNSTSDFFTSADVPRAIPDTGSPMASDLPMVGRGRVVDLEVRVRMDHDWVGDLEAELEHPDGTRVLLMPAVPGGGTNFGVGDCGGEVQWTTFADDGSGLLRDASAPFVGRFRPVEPLAGLAGKTVEGTWRLWVRDVAQPDQGSLVCWGLQIYYEEAGYVCTLFNRTPVAVPQMVEVIHDRPTLLQLGGADGDEDALVFEQVDPPVSGSLTGWDSALGQVLYTPNPGYSGNDSFTFQVSDGVDTSAPATVSLTVMEPAVDLALLWGTPSHVLGVDRPFDQELTVTNRGPNLATGVEVQVALPVDWELLAAESGEGTVVTNESGLLWQPGVLSEGGWGVLRLQGRTPVAGTWTNLAIVQALETESEIGDNAADWVLEARPLVDVALVLSAQADPWLLSGMRKVMAGVTNLGTNVAHELVVTVGLPPGLEWVGVEPGAGVWTHEGGALRWELTELDPGAGESLTWTNRGLELGTWTLAGQVQAWEVEEVPENNASEVTAEVVPAADLSLITAYDSPLLLQQVGMLSVGISNAGPSDAASVVVRGFPGAGVEFLGGTSTVGTWTNGAEGWEWAVGPVPVGGEGLLELDWRGLELGSMTNRLEILSELPDPTPEDNALSPVLETVPAADLSIVLGAPEVLVLGSDRSLSVAVTNAGPSDAVGVSLELRLAEGVGGLDPDPGSGVWTNGTPGEWTWVVGDLPAGEASETVLTLLGLELGAWTHSARLTTATADPDPTGDLAEFTTTVRSDADLAVSVLLEPDLVLLGQGATQRVEVVNHGPNVATGVSVETMLDAGWTLVEGQASVGAWGQDGARVSWDLGTLEAEGSASFTLVLAAVDTGTWTNTSRVAAAELDLQATNDLATAEAEIIPAADLALAVIGPARVLWTAVSPQSVVVTNLGPSSAPGVRLEAQIAAGLSLVSATSESGSVTVSNGAVEWTPEALEPGGSAQLDLELEATELGVWTNVFGVNSDLPDPNPADNAMAWMTAVRREVDLALSLSVSEPSVPLGVPFAYDLGVENLGTNAAQNLSLIDFLPDALRMDAVEFLSGAWTQSVVGTTWQLASLGAGEQAGLRLTVVAESTGLWTNTAWVEAEELDLVETNNLAQATVEIVPAADLALEALGLPTVLLGQPGFLLLNLTNAGPSEAAEIVVSGRLVEPLQLLSGEGSVGSWTNDETGVWEWAVPILSPGSNAVLRLDFAAVVLGAVTNAAAVTASTVDLETTNNAVDWLVEVVPAANLALSSQGGGRVVWGAEGLAELWWVTNAGPSDATGVVVQGLLDGALVITNHQADVGTWSAESADWVWQVGSLAAGEAALLRLEMETRALGWATNHATVTAAEGDPFGGDNSAEVVTAVRLETDLAARQALPESMLLQWPAVWEFGVTNLGPEAAHGVRVTDDLPSTLTILGGEATAGVWEVAEGLLLWEVPALEVGEAATLWLTNRAEAPGSLTNLVAVSAEEIDPVPDNDRVEAWTEVLPAADLSLEMSEGGMIVLGQPAELSVQLTNRGPSAASGVTVTGATDGAVDWVAGVGTTGTWTNAEAGRWEWRVGDLDPGAAAELILTLVGTADGLVTNTVTVAGAEADAVSGNNAVSHVVRVRSDADVGIAAATNLWVIPRGQPFTQEFALTNAGPNSATQVEVLLDLSPVLIPLEVETGAGAWVIGSNQVLWTVGALPEGEGSWLRLVSVAVADGLLTNRVEVTAAEPDLEVANNLQEWTVEALPAADLRVEVVGPAGQLPGLPLHLEVLVTNLGPNAAHDVVLTGAPGDLWDVVQALPEEGVWAPGEEGTWTWELTSLPADAGARLVLDLGGREIGDWTNRVTGAATELDPVSENNVGEWLTRVRLDANLAIAVEAFPGSLLLGEEMLLSLSLTNHGSNSAHSVVVQGGLPAGAVVTAVQSGASSTWLEDASGFRWELETLGVGESAVVSATLQLLEQGATTNAVRVQADEIDLAPADNEALWGVSVLPAADLQVTVPEAGTRLLGTTWTNAVILTNAGPSDATGVMAEGVVPEGLVLVSLGASVGVPVAGAASGAWSWDLGELPAGQAALLEMEFEARELGRWTNALQVLADEGDVTPADRSGAWSVDVLPAADVALAFEGVEELILGAETVWRLTVTNAGPSPATAVAVQGDGSAGVELSLLEASLGDWVTDTSGWTWSLPGLAVGEEAELRLNAAGLGLGVWPHQAVVSTDEADPQLTNNVVTWSMTVRPQADLGVSAEVAAGLVLVGRPVAVTVALTNAGPDLAADVVVTHRFPGGLLVDAVETAQGVVTNLLGQVVWTLESLAPAVDAQLIITLIPTLPEGLTNEVDVVADVVDPVPLNNRLWLPLEVQPLADLRVRQRASAERVMVNDPIRYWVSVENYAPYDVPSAKLTDVLPEGTELLSAVASQGVVSTNARVVTVDWGGVAQGQMVELEVQVAPRQLGVLTNLAELQASTADPDNPALFSALGVEVIRDPPLELETGAGVLRIAWPAVAGGFELQYAETLTPPIVWRKDTTPQTIDGQRIIISIKAIGAGRYYRLVKLTL